MFNDRELARQAHIRIGKLEAEVSVLAQKLRALEGQFNMGTTGQPVDPFSRPTTTVTVVVTLILKYLGLKVAIDPPRPQQVRLSPE